MRIVVSGEHSITKAIPHCTSTLKVSNLGTIKGKRIAVSYMQFIKLKKVLVTLRLDIQPLGSVVVSDAMGQSHSLYALFGSWTTEVNRT